MDKRKHKTKSDLKFLLEMKESQQELIADFRAGKADDRILDILDALPDIVDDIFEMKLKEERMYETQDKLIKLLENADDLHDKLAWKLFWETKDKMMEELFKNRKNNR